MQKRLIFIVLVLLLIPSIVLAGRQDITLKMDWEVVESDVPPFIENGRTYVPVRFIAEQLDMIVDYEFFMYSADWDDIRVTMLSQDGIEIIVDGRGIYREGLNFFREEDKVLPYQIVNERTFVPIRFIADALHMDVYWDQETKTVSLLTNNDYEEYDIFVYNYDNNDCTSYTRVPIEQFKIVYTGSRYELYPTEMTLEEYMFKNAWMPLEKADYDGKVYDQLYTSENLYLASVFFIDVGNGIVEGHHAN